MMRPSVIAERNIWNPALRIATPSHSVAAPKIISWTMIASEQHAAIIRRIDSIAMVRLRGDTTRTYDAIPPINSANITAIDPELHGGINPMTSVAANAITLSINAIMCSIASSECVAVFRKINIWKYF